VLAASLGGITGGKVGADNTTVASCDTDGVTTSYATSWDATNKRYSVSSVTVGGANDACDGETVSLSITDASGTQLGSGTLTSRQAPRRRSRWRCLRHLPPSSPRACT
jgi:hypothetical protein